MKIEWTPLAIQRLPEIANNISYDKPEVAKKFIFEIFDKVKKITQFAEIGRIVPEIKRDEIRELFHKNYRIIYRNTDKKIFILTIRHCRQILTEKDIK